MMVTILLMVISILVVVIVAMANYIYKVFRSISDGFG